MARPAQNGCPYFPLDCDFFEDRKLKLLRGEFGGRAETVIIRLWCSIYSDKGYYCHFNEDDATLMAGDLGFRAGYIQDVVYGACKRGLFDEGVFTRFGVLTSAAIQARYAAVKRKKSTLQVIREYWLLDTSERGENGEPVLNVSFFSVSGEKTPVIAEETAVSDGKTPQSKVKESKVKKSKVKEREKAQAPSAPARLYGLYGNVSLTDEELSALQAEFPSDWQERIERLSEYMASTGRKYESHLATIRAWARKDKAKKQQETGQDMDDPLPY